jgi:uncharacterized membrane protein
MSKMMMLILTASLAALATVFYHIIQRLTPANVNPALALIITCRMAIVFTALMLTVYPVRALPEAFGKLNWASYALGAAVLGIELGVLLAYRVGWPISIFAMVINSISAIGLVIIGIVFLKEKLSIINIAGLVMINLKK